MQKTIAIKKASNKYTFFTHVVFPIASSILIYLLWRGFPLLDPYKTVFPLFSSKHIPGFVKYNLPDGLYLYSFLSALIFIWKEKIFTHGLFWLIVSVLLSFVWEILQIWHINPGTFDPLDLLAYFIVGIFCSFQFQNYKSIHKQITIKI